LGFTDGETHSNLTGSVPPAGFALTAWGQEGLGTIEAAMSWREEVRDRIVELEHMRLLLEEARISARNVGGTEGERLEA
jgi:hypothetical protein